MRTRKWTAGSGLLLASLVLTGCSHDDGKRQTADQLAVSPPAVTATPHLDLLEGKVFPLEAYRLTPERTGQVNNAQSALANKCLQRFGFEPVLKPMAVTRDDGSGVSRRYGVTDPTVAAQFGYHNPSVTTDNRGPAGGGDVSSEVSLVLYGADAAGGTGSGSGSYDGKAIPPGGCLGEAKRALHGDTYENANPGNFVAGLERSAFQQAKGDARVTAKVAEWAKCMATKGYHYSDVFAPVEDSALAASLAAPAPSAIEIQTASADVECKKSVNLIGTWYAVEVAYEEKLIERNQERLNVIKKVLDDMLRAAAAVPA